MDLREVRQLGEGLRVPQGHENDTMVGERRERRDDGRLLPTSRGGGGDEHGRELAEEPAARPELARRVPKVLPLDREIPESRGDAKDERVKLDKIAWGDEGVVGLGGRSEGQDELLGECLRNS